MLTVTEVRYARGLRLPRHAHDDWRLVVPIRGRFVESASGERRVLERGVAILRAAGELHEDAFESESVCLTASVPAALLPTVPRRTLIRPTHASRGISLELLRALVRTDAIAVARDQILARWNRPLRLSEIAASVAVPQARLTRELRATYGCTAAELQRSARVARAAEEIRKRTATMAEIAIECGFYDQSHFCNAFRRVTGMTPSEYASREHVRPRRGTH